MAVCLWWCVWEREGEKGKKERGENGAKERRCKREIKKISQNGKEKITLSFNGAPLGREREEKKEKKTRGGGERMWENIAAQAKKTNIK